MRAEPVLHRILQCHYHEKSKKIMVKSEAFKDEKKEGIT